MRTGERDDNAATIRTVRRTGHWVAKLDYSFEAVYLRRRSLQPILVWEGRAQASSFRTRSEAEDAVRLSGFKGTLSDVKLEVVAQTYAGFGEWRRGEREPVHAS